MDTINNVAAAASKTIFGDGTDKKEPVSGRVGDVSKGEPYDAGNLDPEDQKKFETLPTPTPGTENINPLRAVHEDPVAAATTSDQPTPKGDTSAGQTDPKPNPTDTSDHPEEATVADPKGPGPKPVAVVAREHGGDAGAVGKEPVKDAEGDKTVEETKDSKAAGSGEKVVHASGLAAEGGDFDASNPGAGKEADRLLEEKGIHHGKEKVGESSGNGSGNGNGKKSLKDRIKAKFHKS